MTDKNKNPVTTATGGSTTVAHAEDALNGLWAQLAGSDGKNPVLRATTLNLVIFTKNADTFPPLMEELSETHPCRAIVVQVTNEATGTLSASPTLFCRPTLGNSEVRTQVCCEEILITAGSDTLDRVAGAIQSLLLPDLPVYVLRQGDFAQTETIFKGLSEIIDGLIVDSASFSVPSDGLRKEIALLEAPHFHGTLFDLNWQRLVPWRKALAQTFDAPADRDALAKIREVEIVHHAAEAQALLYGAWLISRLGWDLVPGGKPNTWTAYAAQGNVEIRVRAVEGGVTGLQKVSVKGENVGYSISLSEEGEHLVSSANRVQAQRFQSESVGALIGIIVDVTSPDKVFEEALSLTVMLADDVALPTQRAGVVIAANATSLARLAARYFVQSARASIDHGERFTVALSGGSTPKVLYQLLATSPYREQIPWAKVHVFWGDERNVAVTHPDSNQRMAREALLNHVPIPPDNIHAVATGELSAQDCAVRYAAELANFFKLEPGQLPEFDLILLGLGDDGHTASLFPHSPALEAADSALFVANPIEKLNTTRLTFTAGVINEAARVVFLVSGPGKADIANRVFKGPLQPDELPAQRVKPADGSLVVMVDEDAAAKLRG